MNNFNLDDQWKIRFTLDLFHISEDITILQNIHFDLIEVQYDI